MEPEPRRPPVRYYEIDLLRFLAALSVVFFHYTFRGYAEGSYSPIPYLELGQVSRYGWLGVELFFIISGYVVLLSAQGKTVRQFLISRVTRLYPAFWAACTLTFLVERVWGAAAPGGEAMPRNLLHASLGQYAFNLTMFQDFFGRQNIDGAYWSLAVEITFYFLVALLLGFRLMRHLDLCLAVWLTYVALPGVADPNSPFGLLLFPKYAPLFAAGMLFYLLQTPGGRTPRRYALLLLAYGLALRAGIAHAAELSILYHAAISGWVSAAMITLFFGLFYLITFRQINLGRFTWLAWLGALTYPLYLLHSNIGFIFFHRVGYRLNKYAVLGGTLLAMLGLAYLIHVLVERPLSKPLGTWLSRALARLDAAPAPTVAPAAGQLTSSEAGR